jgi:hypothetical protein
MNVQIQRNQDPGPQVKPESLEPRFLPSFPQSSRFSVRVAVNMTSALKPLVELRVVRQQSAFYFVVKYPRACGDVTRNAGPEETIGLRPNKSLKFLGDDPILRPVGSVDVELMEQ